MLDEEVTKWKADVKVCLAFPMMTEDIATLSCKA